LDTLEEQLKAKKKEKDEIEKEIKWLNLDWADETTLNLQWANVKKLNEKLEKLRSEIEELEEEIKNREQEKKVIEESYWKKTESENIPEENGWSNNETENFKEQDLWEPETLKEIHEQTIKELWTKDETRKDIIKILDTWTWIDDELKERVKKEISDKFFEYYDERLWSLKMKSAKYIKNKLRNKKRKYEEMPESIEKEENLNEIWELEDLFWTRHVWESELSDKIGAKVKKIDMLTKVWWKPVYKVKDENWKFHILRWKYLYWRWWYDKIVDVEDIWWQLVMQVIKNWEQWLELWMEEYKIIKKLKHIWWKQVIVAIQDWDYYVIRWMELQWWTSFSRIDGIWWVKEIWWKLLFCIKYWYFREVYRWDKRCWLQYQEIWEPKEIWWKPCFAAKRDDYERYIVRWYSQFSEKHYEISSEPIDIGWKPVYIGDNKWVYRWDKLCWRIYDQIKGKVKNVDWKPSFVWIKNWVKYRVVWCEEINI